MNRPTVCSLSGQDLRGLVQVGSLPQPVTIGRQTLSVPGKIHAVILCPCPRNALVHEMSFPMDWKRPQRRHRFLPSPIQYRFQPASLPEAGMHCDFQLYAGAVEAARSPSSRAYRS